MTTTDANGLILFSGTDLVAPLHSAVLNPLTSSISAALTNLNAVPVPLLYGASGTWTKPAKLLGIYVRMVGGGGAGGGAAVTAAGQMTGGSGGGSGAYSEAWFAASALPTTVAVTIGAGGAGASGAAGGAGGDTSFGTLLTAGGGLGGGTYAASTSTANTAGGAGGATGTVSGASGNSYRIAGQVGGRTWTTVAGNVAIIGDGGSSLLGQGALATTWNVNGPNATAGNGAGGGGSANNVAQAAARSGGNGSGGVIIVTQFFGSV